MKLMFSFNNGSFIRSINLFQQLRLLYSTSTSIPTSISTSTSIPISTSSSSSIKQMCSFNNGNFIRSTNLFQQLRLLYSTSTSIPTSTSTSSSNSIKDEGDHHNCSISELLVQSLGFSERESLSTFSKYVKLQRGDDSSMVNSSKIVSNAHSVIQFFQQLGFQDSGIKNMVSVHPKLLACKVEKTLKPKMELLMELGFSKSDVAVAISRNPFLLSRDLGPLIHAFRIVLGSDENVVAFLKRPRSYISKGGTDNMIPNVELLRDSYGIPADIIRKLVFMHPNAYLMRTDAFRDLLVRVEHELGIPRHSPTFMFGIRSLYGCPEKKVRNIFAVFESFGWTQANVVTLIMQNPLCLTSSEASTKERLDFLMNQLDYKPDYLASRCSLFTYSLKKRLLPRHQVLQVLKEKGFCKKDHRFISVASLTESMFLERFVLPFEEVHQLYAQLTGRKVGSHTADIAKGQL